MSSRYAFNKSLKELRFLFCNSSPHSDATRAFLKRAYPTMKKNNPFIPIMMREALDTEPRVFARYGLTDKEIEEKVTALVKGSTI
ncbi:NADH-ubiquinone oxidoreductase [Histoplasma capsulatum]|uniref:NADH-ubiquinone oxidoreductase n=1 Tax=Ajellomyces capsulatus TaxID=5037 RepID=A0A8A1M9D3_AJECA|nr:NADH-ubiquinone oxidoreductase [Histoplasma capsulatum]